MRGRQQLIRRHVLPADPVGGRGRPRHQPHRPVHHRQEEAQDHVPRPPDHPDLLRRGRGHLLRAAVRAAVTLAGLLQTGLPLHPAIPPSLHAYHRHGFSLHNHPNQVPYFF